jgi:dimethylhistidine N-methyltransferase
MYAENAASITGLTLFSNPAEGPGRCDAAASGIALGLLQPCAHIAPKYFYDPVGSALFEDITRAPEYYLTRTEQAIMAINAADIALKIGTGGTVIELGAGNCEKARNLCELIAPTHFVAIDISSEFLDQSVADFRALLPSVEVRSISADITAGVSLPVDLPRQKRLVFYPGSSIGNFDPPQAFDLLSSSRELIEDDGALLIGVDLLKEVAVLEAAYNDTAGVTAAFNLNLLSHVNDLIGSNFDLQQWCHRAFFNAKQSRIEMHLEARINTLVRWPGGERAFSCGERIHTENSYKYRAADFIELLTRCGFRRAQLWSDERHWFAVILARP